MEMKYLRLVKTIAEEGNIVNSSEKLFLTQSALSHQLRELENQLGFKVFHRARNKWVLSEEGKVLYKLAMEVLNKIEEGMAGIEAVKSGSKGRIKMSTECYSFYQGLPHFIQKMGLLYPDIDVKITLSATHHPVSRLLANEIDLALVSGKPLEDGLVNHKLYEDEIFALLHREHPLNERPYLSAQDFKEQHLIIHSYPLETVYIYEELLKPNGIKPSKISAVPLTEVALEMIEANLGFACFPKWALKSFKLSPDLVFLPIGAHGLKRMHYVSIRKTDQYKKYMMDFVNNLKDEVPM